MNQIKRFRLKPLVRAIQCAILAQQRGYDPKEVWEHYA